MTNPPVPFKTMADPRAALLRECRWAYLPNGAVMPNLFCSAPGIGPNQVVDPESGRIGYDGPAKRCPHVNAGECEYHERPRDEWPVDGGARSGEGGQFPTSDDTLRFGPKQPEPITAWVAGYSNLPPSFYQRGKTSPLRELALIDLVNRPCPQP